MNFMEPQKPQQPPMANANLNQTPIAPIVKKFQTFDFKKSTVLAGTVIAVILLGVGTGWLVSGRRGSSFLGVSTAPGAKTSPKEAGLADEKTFRDTATGTLEEGGVNGEGTHHLVRDGAGQNVYLTSTVIDLQSFVGKKVQVWGETTAAKKAGWLMDVGKVKVVE